MQHASKDDVKHEAEAKGTQPGEDEKLSKMPQTTRIVGDIFFFTVTMALFAITLVATLYRSYLPQGLSPP